MRIFLIFLLLPLKLLSQDIEGVWTGTIFNDSTRKYIPYEVAISENKNKFSGYSQTIFTGENSIEETGIKTLKIKKKSLKLLIEDDVLIYNNYATPPPKGVKMFSILSITSGPAGTYLIGVFNTNRTKEYASLTGTIYLQKRNKIFVSKLITKLAELNLDNTLSFIKTKSKEETVLPVNTEVLQAFSKAKQKENDVSAINIKEDTIDYKIDINKAEKIDLVDNQKIKSLKSHQQLTPLNKPDILSQTSSTTKPADALQKNNRLLTVNKKPKEILPNAIPTKGLPITVKNSEPVIKSINRKTEVADLLKTEKKTGNISARKEKIREEILIQPSQSKQKSAEVSAPVITYKLAKRTIETIRTVNFKSDSLTLTLYDNGVVDGDTVSVILNGKNIMPKQGLSTIAINKTIYITPDLGDSLQLILYAENLGSIPPNTGLLIIHDGDDTYQIRFAGDLQKNSAVILRRRKN